jgi:hypothetical protein
MTASGIPTGHAPRPPKSTTVRAKVHVGAPPALRWTLNTLERFHPASAVRMTDSLMQLPRRHRRPDWERQGLQSSWPRHLRTGTQRIATWEWLGAYVPAYGRLSDPLPTLLLVHGWEGRGSQLSALVPPLVAAGWRVVTYDAPGHGDSTGRSGGLPAFQNTIRDILDAIGPVAGVIAHSFGAMATASAMQRGAKIPKVALVGPGIWTNETPSELMGLLGVRSRTIEKVMALQAERTGIRWTDLLPEQVYAGRSEPMLVVHDQDDDEIPIERLDRLIATWQPDQVVRTEGLGHRRILRDPTVAQTIADWFGPARMDG